MRTLNSHVMGFCFLVACGSEPAPASSASSARASSAPPVTSSASATTAAKPSSTPSAAAPPSFSETPEPELSEWAKSKVVAAPGSSKNACDTRMVREWLRVQCVDRSPERGTPVSIEVTQGRAPKERYKGENLSMVNDITTLIVPVRPGTDFAANFNWAKGSDVLSVKWPAGQPESAREIKFARAESDGAAPVEGAAPPNNAAAVASEPPLEDLPSVGAAPSEEEWAKVAEARVKGSTAAGCETKLSGDWFFAKCEAKGKPVKELIAVKGHRKTQTVLSVKDDVATILTPYVEGTETHVRMVREGETRVLVLRWSKGPKPETAGSFELPQ